MACVKIAAILRASLPDLRGGNQMPYYKAKGRKKDGLQPYNVRVNYTSESGEYIQSTKTVYGLDAAKALEREWEYEIKVKAENPVKRMTVNQLFEEYISVKKYEVRESTLDKSSRILNWYVIPFMGSVRLDKLSLKLFQNWKITMEERERPLSVTTKKNAYGELRAMLNYAVKMEYLPKNPLLKVGNFKDTSTISKAIKFYIPEQFKKYITVAREQAILKQEQEKSLYEWNFYVFFNIAFYTGMRKGEIHALRWSDIDGEYLSITRSLTQKLQQRDIETPPKNKYSVRTIQIPLPLIKVLEEHKLRLKRTFSFNEDNRILGDSRSVRDTLIQNRNILYAKLAGVDRIRIHDFRHSHASLLANMGINIQEVARRLGHAKIEMTWNTYSHLYPKEEEKAMAVLNAV